MEQDTTELRNKLDALDNMTGDKGWQYFLADILSEVDGLSDQLKYCKPDELGFLQGQLFAFAQIVHFEDLIDQQRKSIDVVSEETE